MGSTSESAAFKLRPMTLSDVYAVLRIERASFPSPWPLDAFLYDLARPGRSICRVAEYNPPEAEPELAGDIIVWLSGRIAHVATLAVHPDYRRQGIGRCLLANALLESVERGMNEALLEVREKNQSAQALYLEFGFHVGGIRKGYYEDTGEDAVLMALKPLAKDKLAELAKCG
jgi:[ribosomal protein S18]-alanine N-acetyltransferase